MYTLPALPYQYDALEPFIDAQTVEIHYSKHHQTYVNNLNKILAENPDLSEKTLEEILTNLQDLPETIRQAILNNAGQVYNHNIYWQSMSANADDKPTGKLLEAIEKTFGGFEKFQADFANAGLTQFGSGWAWLSVGTGGTLILEKTANADSPLIHGKTPILTMDVWEHAYYLKYQNKRVEYIENWWKVVNWAAISSKYEEILAS